MLKRSNNIIGSITRLPLEAGGGPCPVSLAGSLAMEVYPSSVHTVEDACLFLARQGGEKRLWVLSERADSSVPQTLEGNAATSLSDQVFCKQCPMSPVNARTLRDRFDFLRPQRLGFQNSIGLGDRLGVAGPGHLMAVKGSGIRPVLAQQSIRELERTRRSPQEVMDASTWAALQEGFREGFGSDADHLKTFKDIDRLHEAGFTLFTIDPGDYVDNEADRCDSTALRERLDGLPWQELEDVPKDAVSRVAGNKISTGPELTLEPSEEEAVRAWVKYGAAVAHAVRMYRHLLSRAGRGNFELEVSVDEAEAVTTPFEHYFMASELQRLGVEYVSLAPRFVGDFEKGVDYRGEPEVFRKAYASHLAVSRLMGGYKISFHSGSDKFRVYRIVASFPQSRFHIKTAGTSYLEALRTLAVHDPDLFRKILDSSKAVFPEEKATYHVSAQPDRVPCSADCTDPDLPVLLDQDDTRQVLHVAYGRVLTREEPDGTGPFKKRILDSLKKYERAHYQNLNQHIRRHLAPFTGEGFKTK